MQRKDERERKTYSVDEFCEMYAIGRPKAIRMIRDGQLAAVNVGLDLNKRPRWRIPEWAIEQWEQSRLSTPVPKPKRKSRAPAQWDVVKFY